MRTSKPLSPTSTRSAKPIKLKISSLIFSGLLVFSATPTFAQERELKDMNIPLKVGVVQHFGEKPTDQLILKAQPGDHLTLKFPTPEGDKILHTESVILKMGVEALPEPQVEERIVFSTHRSYESAEEAANQWRSLSPDNWPARKKAE